MVVSRKYICNSITARWPYDLLLFSILDKLFYLQRFRKFLSNTTEVKNPCGPVVIKINEKTQKLHEVPLGRFLNEI